MAAGKVSLFMTELKVRAKAFNKELVAEIESALIGRYTYKPEEKVQFGELIFSTKKITNDDKKLKFRKVTIALIIVGVILFVFIFTILICAFCVVGVKADEIKSRSKKLENDTNEMKLSSEKLEKENEEKERLLKQKKTKPVNVEEVHLESQGVEDENEMIPPQEISATNQGKNEKVSQQHQARQKLHLDEGTDWEEKSINSEHEDIDDSKKLNNSNSKKTPDNSRIDSKKDKAYSSILKK